MQRAAAPPHPPRAGVRAENAPAAPPAARQEAQNAAFAGTFLLNSIFQDQVLQVDFLTRS